MVDRLLRCVTIHQLILANLTSYCVGFDRFNFVKPYIKITHPTTNASIELYKKLLVSNFPSCNMYD